MLPTKLMLVTFLSWIAFWNSATVETSTPPLSLLVTISVCCFWTRLVPNRFANCLAVSFWLPSWIVLPLTVNVAVPAKLTLSPSVVLFIELTVELAADVFRLLFEPEVEPLVLLTWLSLVLALPEVIDAEVEVEPEVLEAPEVDVEELVEPLVPVSYKHLRAHET